nr:sphingoid long-chain bases kinase 1 [Ipomoea batatas]
MQKSGSLSKNNSLKLAASPQSLRRLGICSQISTGQHSSPVVFPEKRSKGRSSARSDDVSNSGDSKKEKGDEHRIDMGDENSDLLGYDVFSGKLTLDKKNAAGKNGEVDASKCQNAIDAKLTSKAMIWGSDMLALHDIVSVSYCPNLRHFTVHSYPRRTSSGLTCFMKAQRTRKDFRFVASTPEDALQWVSAFADQQCYVNLLPHPLGSSKKQETELATNTFPPESYIRCKTPPKMLVILNPRSGRGRSSKVFYSMAEPIFKLAGFKLEVVKTTSAGHARKLASTVDFSTCPDGIICVGGDGIINEVLNGLLCRDNQKEAISIPIGIIPAGSDNSLVWTVLGVRDPISAAIAIVKGGLTATDVFAVEWVQSGQIHFGTTVSYFGFVSDVLELSEKYQKRFGPLRYFVAGFLKFLCLPKYNFEVEYLPASKEVTGDGKASADREVIDMSALYTDIMRRSGKEGLPRPASLSSIDSMMSPSRMSGANLDTNCSSTEPSDYVRGIDSKSKRLSFGRINNSTAEPEVIHPQLPLASTPKPRTRSKSRTDKGWNGLTATNESTRCSWGNATTNDKEDISSTISDPGPIWDPEPRWDTEPNYYFHVENPIELPGPPPEDTIEVAQKEIPIKSEEKWVSTKGQFLGVLVCNHACKTVQSLSSQILAPKAEHDDNMLDLLLVRGSGRLKLLRFLLLLQMGRHITLPYVEYVKVKSVKVKPGKRSHNGCGIDGELFPINGTVISSILPEQCRLIGRPQNK